MNMPFLRRLKLSRVAGMGVLLVAPTGIPQESGAPSRLQNLIPHDQLSFLNGLAGAT